MAGRYDLKIEDIRTDANEIMNDTGYMLMRVHVTGDFMKFREFSDGYGNNSLAGANRGDNYSRH